MSTSSHMRDIIKNIMAYPEKYYKLTIFVLTFLEIRHFAVCFLILYKVISFTMQ